MPVPCPCCKASNESGPNCRRCKADLSLLFAADADHAALTARARQLAAQSRYHEAVATLDHAARLRHSPEVLRLRAAVLVLAGHYSDALRAYHELATPAGKQQ